MSSTWVYRFSDIPSQSSLFPSLYVVVNTAPLVCHIGEIPGGVTSHSTIIDPIDPLSQRAINCCPWMGICHSSQCFGHYVQCRLGYNCFTVLRDTKNDQGTSEWSLEPGYMSINKTGLWHPRAIKMNWRWVTSQQHPSWNELWTALQESWHS